VLMNQVSGSFALGVRQEKLLIVLAPAGTRAGGDQTGLDHRRDHWEGELSQGAHSPTTP
jgi:hypothetical protein